MTLPLTVVVTPTGQILGGGPEPLVGIPAIYTFGPAGAVIAAPQIVPVQPVQSQVFNVTLNSQVCTIKLYFKTLQIPMATQIVTDPPVFETVTILFMDLYVNNALIIGGVRCINNNRIVRDAYLGFIGDLYFVDTQGSDDAQQSGLGSRWLLAYQPALT